jgi:stage II sporulation protein M
MENIKFKFTLRMCIIPAVIYLAFMIVGMSVGFNSKEEKFVADAGFIDIFNNNLAGLCINFSGIFTFGVTTIINLVGNGFIHGLAIRHYVDKYSIVDALIRCLPHGIFEIPAIIFSGTVGFLPLVCIYNYIREKKEGSWGIKEILKILLVLVMLSLIFLIIGAFIESILIKILF